MGVEVVPAAAMIIPVRYYAPKSRDRAFGISAAGLRLLVPCAQSLLL